MGWKKLLHKNKIIFPVLLISAIAITGIAIVQPVDEQQNQKTDQKLSYGYFNYQSVLLDNGTGGGQDETCQNPPCTGGW